eukprot:scaffold179_cov71-Skeletonema_dohrnii-CCMP3373.AAC.1
MAADRYYIYNGREAIPRNVMRIRVRIHESVTVIPARAFEDSLIQEVECHIDVKTVEEYAFNNCYFLEKVIMPGVEVVKWNAFTGCSALMDVKCDKLEIVRESSFRMCQSLRSIDLPSAKIVESFAFNECTDLVNVKFGIKLESIKERAFLQCTSLDQITIPLKDGIITRDDIFRWCENLEQIDLVEEAVLSDTIDALQLEEWKNDMNEEIISINQILPNTPHQGKARAIRMWIQSVLSKIVDYKAQHRSYLNEAATTIQHALKNDDIVLNNILPFLKLPSYTFQGEDTKRKRTEGDVNDLD